MALGQWLTPGAAGTPVAGQWIEYPANNAGGAAKWDASGAIYADGGLSFWIDVWAGPVPSAIEGSFSGAISGSEIAEIVSNAGSIFVVPQQSGSTWTLNVRSGSNYGTILASTSWNNAGQRVAIGYASGTCYVYSGTMRYSITRTATSLFFCYPGTTPRLRDIQVGTWPLSSPPQAPTVTPMVQEVEAAEGGGIQWTHNATDGTAQTAYEVRWSSDGGTTWDTTGKTAGVDDLWGSGTSWTAGTTLSVQVRTWGGYILEPSPWSATATIDLVSTVVPTVRLLGVSAGAQSVATSVRLLGVSTNAGADAVTIVSPPQGTIGYPWGELTVTAASVSGTDVTWSATGPVELTATTGTTATLRVLSAMPVSPVPGTTGRVSAVVTATLPTGEAGSLTLSIVPQAVWAWDPTTGTWVSGGPEPAVPGV